MIGVAALSIDQFDLAETVTEKEVISISAHSAVVCGGVSACDSCARRRQLYEQLGFELLFCFLSSIFLLCASVLIKHTIHNHKQSS
jgi:hypothetical protein